MTRRRWALIAATALVAALTVAAAPASKVTHRGCGPADHPGGEWRMYGHDLMNTRHQPAEEKIGPAQARQLAPVWELNANAVGGAGSFTGTPVIADGCVYVGSTAGWVFAANADTGALVWKTDLTRAINNSVTVVGGKVYGVSGLRAFALDQRTGELLWESDFLDQQDGADIYGAPLVVRFPPKEGSTEPRDIMFVGVSGGGAELGDEETRYKFRGRYVLLDAASGKILLRRWTIPPKDWEAGYAGGGVWATPAFDVRSGHAYVGSGNPFQPEVEHAHTNAILKIDLHPDRRTFGAIVGSYKGTLDTYFEGMNEMPCVDISGNPPPWYPQGLGACFDNDLDFGASPNLFRDADGRLLVGEGQKSGEYHVVDAKTMERQHIITAGPPSAIGGIVGSTAFDGRNVHGPVTIGGYLWSADPFAGSLRWVSPIGDGPHWAHAVSSANGVVYTIDVPGWLRAYDAETGVPLLALPQSNAAPVGANLGGGVAIARNTVYGITGSRVVALRPGGAGGSGGGGGGDDGGGGDGGGGGSPAGGSVVLAQPGSFATSYTTRATVAQKGGRLTFVNGDLQPHDVVAYGHTGPGDQPWCAKFPKGKCPLFWSELIGAGQTTPVQGLENLEPGSTYTFYCTIHPSMRGTLVATG